MNLDLEQGWLRLLAESRRNPFQQPGPLFFEANLPMLASPRRVDTSQGALARARCCPALDDWVLLQAAVATQPLAARPEPADLDAVAAFLAERLSLPMLYTMVSANLG